MGVSGLVVSWLLLLSLGSAQYVPGGPDYDVEVTTYPSQTAFTCPDGWHLIEGKCYEVFNVSASWSQARSTCLGYAGQLVTVNGKHLNKELGRLVADLTQLTDQGEPDGFWIGYNCDVHDPSRCYWADGSVAVPYGGYWDHGQPRAADGNCVKIGLVGRGGGAGQHRWQRAACSEQQLYVCEAAPCLMGEYRCQDGRGCVTPDWLCDGFLDCGDGSDEYNCGVPCGGLQTGSSGSLTSPQYPSNYPLYADCRWTLQAPLGGQLELKFDDFETEADFDAVHVYEGWVSDTDRLLAQGSGDVRPGDVTSKTNRLLVTFKADHADQRQGFQANWRTLDRCGGRLTVKPEWQTLLSPGYPAPYPDQTDCVWRLHGKDTDIITLQFHDFDTEAPYDWLQVRDGKETNASLLGHYTGQDLPQLLMTTQSHMRVTLSTDIKLRQRRGFNASYTAGCHVALSQPYGVIESPGYPASNYPLDLNCSWTLTAPSDRGMTLVFQTFHTEYTYDAVTLYSSNSLDPARRLGVYSGLGSPGAIHSPAGGGGILVQFVTDSSRSKQGWTAHFSWDCPPVYPLPASVVGITTNDTHLGAAVSYICQLGLGPDPDTPRQCGQGGVWDTPPPACKPVSCGPPPQLQHGYVTSLSGQRYGDTVTYACSPGHSLGGSASASCEAGGWSHTPTCTVIECLVPTDPTHGTASYSHRTPGAILSYKCYHGYTLWGRRKRVCTQHGNWSANQPTCQRTRCPDPSPVAHGSVNGSAPYLAGDLVEVWCHPGYRPTHPRPSCTDNGTWTHPVTCMDHDECVDLGSNPCGDHSCINLAGGFKCQCRKGYVHGDPTGQTCIDVDECEYKNGFCDGNCTNTVGGYMCSCAPGYELYSGTTQHPSLRVNHSKVNHSCIPLTCDAVPAITHARHFASLPPNSNGRHDFGTHVTVFCNLGYVANGSDHVVCREGGIWDAPWPVCQYAVCAALPPVPFGQLTVSAGRRVYGEARYSCQPGFMLHGPARRHCAPWRHRGTYHYAWTGVQPQCLGSDCGPLPAPRHGTRHGNATTYSARVRFACDTGYYLRGSHVRTCQWNSTWSGEDAVCQPLPGCPHPGYPQNGDLPTDLQSFPVGTRVHFQCARPGYTLTDPRSIECIVDDPSMTTIETTTAPMTTIITSTPTPPIGDSCRVGLSASYIRTDNLGNVTQNCAREYGNAAWRQLQSALAQVALLCPGSDVTLRLHTEANITVTNNELVTIETWLVVLGEGDVQECANNLYTQLTTPQALDAFPTLQEIGSRWLTNCTTTVTMQPRQLSKNGLLCSGSQPVSTPSPTQTPASTMVTVSFTPPAVLPECDIAFTLRYVPAPGVVVSQPTVCVQEYGTAVLATLHGALDMRAIACGPHIGAHYTIRINLTNTDVVMAVRVTLSGYVGAADCMDSMHAFLTQSDLLDLLPSLRQLDVTQLVQCTVPVLLDGAGISGIAHNCTGDMEGGSSETSEETTSSPGNAKSSKSSKSSKSKSKANKRRKRAILDAPAPTQLDLDYQDLDLYPIDEGHVGLPEWWQPYWNSNTPDCIDVEPPRFDGCPDYLEYALGPDGPVLVNVTLPSVTDNSGVPPTLSLHPQDLRSPYPFTLNTTVRMVATDGANNTATCEFPVYLIDVTPPTVLCPLHHVIQYVNTSAVLVTAQFPDVNVSDWSGVSHVTYAPPQHSSVPMRRPVRVTVTAYDDSGNNNSCSFYYQAQPLGCPEWSLEAPSGGNRSCSGNIQGQNASGYACALRCPSHSDFLSDADLYLCRYGGSWLPHNYVPDCSDRLFPDYALRLRGNFTADGAGNCSGGYTLGGAQGLAALLDPLCDPITQHYNISVTTITTPQNYTDMVEVEIHVLLTVVDVVGIGPEHVQWCARQAPSRLNHSLCGVSENGMLEVVEEDYVCLPGHVLRKKFCLACTPGMYHNLTSDECESCHKGAYQDLYGQTECTDCPEYTSTRETNTKYQSQCISMCGPGEMSPDGLQPCDTCAVGQHQGAPGARRCEVCPPGTTTAHPGATGIAFCREDCPAGWYSADGLAPCGPCPPASYQADPAARSCRPCSPGHTTARPAANSSALCVEEDFCLTEPCLNNGTCDSLNTTYCHCPHGYTGRRCGDEVDHCLSAPCHRNASCVSHPTDGYTCVCHQGYTGGQCDQLEDHCAVSPCVHGYCVAHLLTYSCMCHQGYEGHRCENVTDHCEAEPCENSGMCTNMDTTYRCNCTDTGYGGRNCSIEVDDCASRACLNGALCEDEHMGFNCTCLSGYTGYLCETEVDYCTPDLCANGGFCTSTSQGSICICPAGYTGPKCETPIDNCAPSPCNNSATCVNQINGFVCICPTGYEGGRCEIQVNLCDSAPCRNLGSCISRNNSFSCVCLHGFTGIQCETDVNECAHAPCQNNATCVDRLGDYVCECGTGWAGSICSEEVDECAGQPCVNNGTCEDRIGWFRCACAEGWTGARCDVEADECEPEPCANNATCVDNLNGYTCICAAGWAGPRCEDLLDTCRGQPCHHGATCRGLINDFSCTCTPGYTGKTCADDVDECASSPCQNNGTCEDAVAGYNCTCSDQHSGDLCQAKVNNCVLNNTCKHGATCVDAWRGVTCVCPPRYHGLHCQKTKSPDFDLYFPGGGGRAAPPVYAVRGVKAFTLCVWVRYAGSTNTRGTYLSVAETGIDLDPVIVFHENGTTVSMFSTGGGLRDVHIPWSPLGGAWHHACLSWRSQGGGYNMYVNGRSVQDGTGYGDGRELNVDLQVVLGQSLTNPGGAGQFHGEVSNLNLFTEELEEAQVAELASNCSVHRPAGELVAWTDFGAGLQGDVMRREPAVCGRDSCPPGYMGSLCDISIDKEAPSVVFCPNDTLIVDSNSRLVQVNWTDPIFSDNIGVVNITQTHRPGLVLAYGEYSVLYTAYDVQGSSAICRFKLYILPYDCAQPPPPEKGLAAYGWWTFGQYSRIRCVDETNYEFVRLPPPFYKCGALGAWDPPSGQPFRYPACAEVFPPVPGVAGYMGALSPLPCSPATRQRLRDSFVSVMRHVDAAFGVCPGPGGCDYSGVRVSCDGGRRRRRQADTLMQVDFGMPVKGGATSVGGQSYSPAELLELQMKQGNFSQDPDYQPQGYTVVDTMTCPTGRVLNAAQTKCVNCPVGTRYAPSLPACEPCPAGEYTPLEGQTACTPCGAGLTTRDSGATSSAECYDLCPAGQYYDAGVTGCALCPHGYYQTMSGQDRCTPCATGQTTTIRGATTANMCTDACGAGAELAVGGRCAPCPRGTYRGAMVGGGAFCARCAYGFTTAGPGATAPAHCSIVECPAGSYQHTDGQCVLCPVGAHQSGLGRAGCEPCPRGTTTPHPGAVTAAQCVPGHTDRCATGAHSCHSGGGACAAQDDWYTCYCRDGWRGDGYNCTDVCDGYCHNEALCSHSADGGALCSCGAGWTGPQCRDTDPDKLNRDAMIGGIIAGVLVIIIIIVVTVLVLVCRRKPTTMLDNSSSSGSDQVDILHRAPRKHDPRNVLGLNNGSPADPTQPRREDSPPSTWNKVTFADTLSIHS